jgi:hypothetical protein
MARHLTLLALLLGLSLSAFAQTQSKLPSCPAVDYSKNTDNERFAKWHNCFGRYTFELEDYEKGHIYEGEFQNGTFNGIGTYTRTHRKHFGEWKDGKKHGQGIETGGFGINLEGTWVNNNFYRSEKINLSHVNQQTDVANNEESKKLDADRHSQSKLPPCPKENSYLRWNNCIGTYTYTNGDKYVGEFKDGKWHGQGTLFFLDDGTKYSGEFKDDKPKGLGTFTFANGYIQKGIYADGKFVSTDKVNSPPVNQHNDVALNEERIKLDADRQAQRKLPPCPPVDHSKKKHTGLGGRTEKWHNCFGKYVSEDNDWLESHVYEGEFNGGTYNGQGTKTFLGRSKYVGKFEDGSANYVGKFKDGKYNGQGTFEFGSHNHKYVGEWKDGSINGQGTYTQADGTKYVGEWKNGAYHGKGIETYADGRPAKEGIWAVHKFIRAEKINLPPVQHQTDVAINEERKKLDADRQALEVERQRLTEERNRREQAKQSSKLSLQTTTTSPDVNGNVIISVRTNADTSSLKVNGEEQGGRPDGNYTIKRVARVGQDTQFTITAVDIIGNTDTTTITVARQAVSPSSNQTASLKPESIKRAPARDAVAIIIGIQNYKRVPKADFANNDAKEFYEYAIRGLGIKPENIKLLVDEEADDLEIVKAFENWLPLQVTKNKTDVYVFYSGHGLPSPDGQSLYFLPYGVDKQYLARTAVGQKEVVALLTASKPKSVTMFIDACYSGQTRSGEMMIASVRPLAVKSEASVYPSNFTVISASSNDQYSSSSPELKHGIFSFYLMKGMEGDADGNKDGKITAGEMQEYLSDKVSRQAMSMSRKQDTQLVGDAGKVLIDK